MIRNSRINLKIFKEFIRSESIGGVVLLLCVIISLIIANSTLGKPFEQLLGTTLGFNYNSIHLEYPVLIWINDGLMGIFFLFVSLEIKRELLEGELSNFRKAALPVFAAVGGAVIPALIFFFFNSGTDTVNGWGIPMATDIAFALGVLSLLGNKVPGSLKIFLAALAIADDLIAILVIAIFYTSHLSVAFLSYAGAVFVLMLIFNKIGIKNLLFYIIPGLFIWYFIHHSGIHATIAGVLTAVTIPTNKHSGPSPLEKLEHFLAKPVNFIIMPIFALANTNISFHLGMTDGLYSYLGLGIIIGLLLGKPIGITFVSWIVVRMGWGTLPRDAQWKHILGLGLLGGIGFTMSIFIALLSFNEPSVQVESKFAILVASVLSGISGFLLLRFIHKTGKLKKEVSKE